MTDKEINQHCICSLGLAPECPAHPFRERRYREKPKSEEVRASPCAACKVIGVRDHVNGRHKLSGYSEVARALTLGTVYVTMEKYKEAGPMVVRDCSTPGLSLQVLEGWQSGPFTEIWMEAKRETKTNKAA